MSIMKLLNPFYELHTVPEEVLVAISRLVTISAAEHYTGPDTACIKIAGHMVLVQKAYELTLKYKGEEDAKELIKSFADEYHITETEALDVILGKKYLKATDCKGAEGHDVCRPEVINWLTIN